MLLFFCNSKGFKYHFKLKFTVIISKIQTLLKDMQAVLNMQTFAGGFLLEDGGIQGSKDTN
jgi:hypothetical protein